MQKVTKLPEYIEINNHTIKLEKSKQPLFRLIYSLRPVVLKMLKIYIKTNLVNGFIWLFKSPIGAPILFDRKPDGNFRFYMDYQGLNNLNIKIGICFH